MVFKTIEGGQPEFAKFEKTFERDAYFSDDYFQKELENIWFKSWLCAGRAEEIPNVGDFLTVEIGNENLIVIRAADDSINTFYNVCQHRGSRLCETDKGNFSKGYLTCHYHSWMYDGSTGELVNAPNIDPNTKDFDKKERSLDRVNTEVWDGYIWINLDENAPSLKESFALPESWELYGKYNMKDLTLGEKKTYKVAANWKFVMENASECYHCSNIHPELSRVSPPSRPRVLVDEGIPETEVVKHTGGMDLRPGFDRVNIDGKVYREPFPGLNEEEIRSIYYLHIYPHLYIGLACDYIFIATMFPISPDETIVQGYWLFEPKVLEEKGYIQDAVEFWDVTSLQDWEACELAHLGNRSRTYKEGILTPVEWRTAAFKHYVQSKVGY